MTRTTPKRICALLFLLILLAAYTGQQVHIYLELPERFAAFNGGEMPENGARCQVVQLHVVDNFCFYPFLTDTPLAHGFYAEVLSMLCPAATQCKQATAERGVSLRAPPAV